MDSAAPQSHSKVAVIGPSTRPDADVDYLFLQVVVNEPESCVTELRQYARRVAPFALENGLVPVTGERTRVRIHMSILKVLPSPRFNARRSGAVQRLTLPLTVCPERSAHPPRLSRHSRLELWSVTANGECR